MKLDLYCRCLLAFAAVALPGFCPAAAVEPPPTLLQPIDKARLELPVLTSVTPRPVDDQDFIVTTRHVLEVARKHPAPTSHDMHFQVDGVGYWPASAVTKQALELLATESAAFQRGLRDDALACRQPQDAPADAQVIAFEAGASDVTVPVFLTPDSGELNYIELSLDKPGAPVVLLVTGYNGLALRISASGRTRLAAVHLQTYYPNIVLGIDPARVTQSYYRQGRGSGCSYRDGRGRAAPGLPPGGPKESYKMARGYRVAIGGAVPVDRASPRLGNFLDLDMPAPHNYGIVVLNAQGYVRQVKAQGEGERGPVHGGLQVIKPFRIPQGLHGSHSVTFLLKPDSPVPSGDLGHSTMLRLPQ